MENPSSNHSKLSAIEILDLVLGSIQEFRFDSDLTELIFTVDRVHYLSIIVASG